jgi:lipid A ethanolaminephosphotransferase
MAPRIAVTPGQLGLLTSLFIVAGLNTPFWGRLLVDVQPAAVVDWLFVAAFAAALVAILNAALSVAAFPFVLKPVAATLVILSASIAYFAREYGTAIDANMVRNILETDTRESEEFLTAHLFGFIFLLGVIPAGIIAIAPINWRPLPQTATSNAVRSVMSSAIAAALILAFYANFASTIRENRGLLLTLVPSNVIIALSKYQTRKQARTRNSVSSFGEDARRDEARPTSERPLVTVLVVGETARAANFSLNGYVRSTNPRLSRIDGVLSLKHVSSCGTDTAHSVPCMFSGIGEKKFTVAKAANQENLLHVLKRADLDVLWRDNQSGCKGVCKDVETESLTRTRSAFHTVGVSYDEVLLDGLESRLAAMKRGGMIVLHMIGSHGPAYFKRVPPSFVRFQPTCETSQLSRCTVDQIVNSYDNTILYTDHVLAELIGILRAAEAKGIDTAMIYVSDHGESLGEKGLYLHGMPRALAPKEQTHIPMIVWASPAAQVRLGMDMECLQEFAATKAASHDNLFHTVLGIFAIRTRLYDPRLDILHRCRADLASRM